MSDPTRRSMREYLGIGALVTLPVLCCAAPALLAAGALGASGFWLVNPWLIGVAVLAALSVLGWGMRQRATVAKADRYGPTPPPHPAPNL